MKLFLLTIFQLLIASQLWGQTSFEVEGKQIKTGTVSRTYNFAYSFGDSLSLIFVDSVVQYSNSTKTILKTNSYSGYRKGKPSIKIEYFGTNGQDSISKHFYEGKPSMIYQTKYDKRGRIVYYGMKDFNADSTHDQGFEWFYEYRDSLISTGKIEIQTILVVDADGEKRFHFRVLSVYDNMNRKVKEVRERKSNDPMSQITTYSYNEKDSMISEKVGDMEILQSTEKHINTNCDIENEYSFSITDFNSVKQLVNQLLLKNKNILKSNDCENYFFTLIAPDKQTRLTLVKHKPYRAGRRVIFTTTKSFNHADEK